MKQCVQFHPGPPGLPVSHLAECTIPRHWAGLSTWIWGQDHEPILQIRLLMLDKLMLSPAPIRPWKAASPSFTLWRAQEGSLMGTTGEHSSVSAFWGTVQHFFRLRNWGSEKSIAENHSWTHSLHMSRYLFLDLLRWFINKSPACDSLHVPIFLSVWNLQSLCLDILSLHCFIFFSDSRMPVKCVRLPLSSKTIYIFFLVSLPLFQTLL